MVSHIAFYKFVKIVAPASFQSDLKALCVSFKLKGTVLIADEGINGMLAGVHENIAAFKTELLKDARFADISFKESVCEKIPFRRLLIRVKKEILTLRYEGIDPAERAGAYIKPQELEEWLDRGEDVVLLDTRNSYEIEYGTFKNAIDPKLKSFGQFPKYVREHLRVPKDKKVVTFCTGGIRCEKATAVMLNAGFTNVYQLEGGILSYLANTSGKFWDGTCFVFDEREALDRNLQPIVAKNFGY